MSYFGCLVNDLCYDGMLSYRIKVQNAEGALESRFNIVSIRLDVTSPA